MTVIYLRKCKNLCTIELSGNPVCKDENFKASVTAYLSYLSDLVHLDYRLLDDETGQKAQYQYGSTIEKIKHNELQEQKAAEAPKKMEQDLQLPKEEFVEYLNGPHLFGYSWRHYSCRLLKQVHSKCKGRMKWNASSPVYRRSWLTISRNELK